MKAELYKIDIRKVSRSEFHAAYLSMSLQRKTKCDMYRREQDKKLCIAADMLLRKALSEVCDILPQEIIFDIDSNGKPFAANCNVPFNISHSGDFVVVAVGGENSIGVDIELIRPLKSLVLKHFCSDKDIEYILGNNCFRNEIITDKEILSKCFQVWTFKEAFVKCTGEGISEKIREISLFDKDCFSEKFEDYYITMVSDVEVHQ